MDLKMIIKRESHEVTLDTPIGGILIPTERNLYVAFEKQFMKYADTATRLFLTKYNYYKNYRDVLNNSYDALWESINFILEEYRKTFINLGVYDLSFDDVQEKVEKSGMLSEFDEVYDDFAYRANAINGDLNAEMDYRQQRKDNRGQWVGASIGGGMVNAVATQGKVAAMNAASGAAHSVVNAIGNMASQAEADEKLEELFSNYGYKDKFEKAVYKSVLELKWLYLSIESIKELVDWISPEEEEKADRLLNNLCLNEIPPNKRDEVICEVFQLNPYDRDLYYYLFDTFGDDGTLSGVAEYFGTTRILNEIKVSAANYYFSTVRDGGEDCDVREFESEEEVIKAKALVEEYCEKNRIEITEDSYWMKEIKSVLADFDLKYRTVEDVEHETREAADFSREELPKIQAFMESVQPMKGEPLLPYERDLIAKKEEFENTFSSEISKKYIKTIESYLETFEKSFLAVGVLGASNREEASRKRALKYAKGLKYNTVEEFNKQYETFCKFIEENLDVSIEEATEAKDYLAKKKDRLERGASALSDAVGSIGSGLKGLFGKR